MNRREFLHSGAAAWLAGPAAIAAPRPQDDVPRAGSGAPLGGARLESTVAGLPRDGVLAAITAGPQRPGEMVPVLANDLVGVLYLQQPEPVFAALEQAIQRKLVALESERLAVVVAEATLNEAVDGYLKDQVAAFQMKFGSGSDFVRYMQEQYGTTPTAYRAILKDVVHAELLLERVVRYSARQSERIQFRLITTSSLETAKSVHEKLQEGASFAALARAESIDENTKKNGGLLPPLPVDAEHVLAQKTAQLEIGAISEVGAETKLGRTIYWITKLEKRLPADPRPYAATAQEIETELAGGRVDLQEVVLWELNVRKRYPIDVRLGR
jgi:parvulin-like peptidyl-prolyl isomerase